MVTRVAIPKLGLTMKKATVVKWLKNEGEQVAKGEPIVQIETEKVTHRIEASDQGVLLKIVAPVKSVLPVGGTVGYIGQPGEAIPEPSSPETVQPIQRANTSESTATQPAAVVSGIKRASPRAKKLAEEKGVDLSKVSGTGPQGMIMEEDISRYLESTLNRTSRGLKVKQVIPMSATRQAIGENMVSSLQSTAQVTLNTDVDASELKRVHDGQDNPGSKGNRPSYTDMLVRIVAQVLEEHSIINSTLEDDTIKIIEEINIGVAVALDAGLVVPVVTNANKRSLSEISEELRRLVEKANRGDLTLEDVGKGTFTITNLGAYGTDAFTPIINPPQSAILGVGRMAERAVVVNGNILARPMMTLSLTFDHRVMDGHVAATFLDKLKKSIASPNAVATLSS